MPRICDKWDVWSTATIANWALFYGWVIAITSFCCLVVGFATARLSEGLQATYEVRRGTIKDLRLYVGVGMAYWLVASACYLLLMLRLSFVNANRPSPPALLSAWVRHHCCPPRPGTLPLPPHQL